MHIVGYSCLGESSGTVGEKGGRVSEEAANRLIQAFEGAANSLETMPKRCPWLVSEYISRLPSVP